MGSAITLFQVRGIEVRVHWTFILILLYGAFSYRDITNSPTAGAAYGVMVILLLFLCVTLHEFGHALVAQYFKVKVPSITLLPIGGVAQLERMPDKPFQEFLIAIAGPLVNFAISLLLLPVWLVVVSVLARSNAVAPLSLGVFTIIQRLYDDATKMGLSNILAYLILINMMLALFNLLPAFPMDGGRILRSVLATAMPYVQATRLSVMIGRFIAVALAIWGVSNGNISALLVAFFVYVGGGAEQESVESRAVLKDIPIADALTHNAANLYTSEHISKAVDLIMSSYQTDYPVLDLSGNFVGVLTRARLITGLREQGPDARVVDVMIAANQLPSMSIEGNLAQVWEKITSSGSRAVAIRQGTDFKGLITIDDISELFQVMGASFDHNMQAGGGSGQNKELAGGQAGV